MRENGEVTSGIYLVRNDPRAYCFLAYWRAFHANWIPPSRWLPKRSILPVPNNCNGALVSAVLFLVTQEEGVDCLRTLSYNLSTRPYPYPEQACLDRFRRKVYELSQLNITDTELAKFGVRLLWKRDGLWRSHEKYDPAYSDTGQWELFCRCYPSSDLIGHGNKDIARDMLEAHHTRRCAANMSSDTVRGVNRKCIWYTLHQERAIVRKYCLWRSPACMASNRTNHCLTPSRKHRDKGHRLNPSCLEYRDLISLDIERRLYDFDLSDLFHFKLPGDKK